MELYSNRLRSRPYLGEKAEELTSNMVFGYRGVYTCLTTTAYQNFGLDVVCLKGATFVAVYETFSRLGG